METLPNGIVIEQVVVAMADEGSLLSRRIISAIFPADLLCAFLVSGLFLATLGPDDSLLRCRSIRLFFAHDASPLIVPKTMARTAAMANGSALLDEKVRQACHRGGMRGPPAFAVSQVMISLRHALQALAGFALRLTFSQFAEFFRSAAKICGIHHGASFGRPRQCLQDPPRRGDVTADPEEEVSKETSL
jgi:hypothetical protein